MTRQSPTLDASSLPPLPELPPLPDREVKLPQAPAASAAAILSRPGASFGVGQRPMSTRRVASLWEKMAYVAKPVLITPVVVGTGMIVGCLALGAAAGALAPGVSVAAGIGLAGVFGGGATATTVGVLQVVGLFQALSRVRTSRVKLGQILEDRRNQKTLRNKHPLAASAPRRPRAAR